MPARARPSLQSSCTFPALTRREATRNLLSRRLFQPAIGAALLACFKTHPATKRTAGRECVRGRLRLAPCDSAGIGLADFDAYVRKDMERLGPLFARISPT